MLRMQTPAQRFAQLERDNQQLRRELDQARRMLAAPDRPAMDAAMEQGLQVIAAAAGCPQWARLLQKRQTTRQLSSAAQRLVVTTLFPVHGQLTVHAMKSVDCLFLLQGMFAVCQCLQDMKHVTAELTQQLANSQDEGQKYRSALLALAA